jgi:hypothetical protein
VGPPRRAAGPLEAGLGSAAPRSGLRCRRKRGRRTDPVGHTGGRSFCAPTSWRALLDRKLAVQLPRGIRGGRRRCGHGRGRSRRRANRGRFGGGCIEDGCGASRRRTRRQGRFVGRRCFEGLFPRAVRRWSFPSVRFWFCVGRPFDFRSRKSGDRRCCGRALGGETRRCLILTRSGGGRHRTRRHVGATQNDPRRRANRR